MYARDQDHEYANMLILKAFQGLNQMLSKMRTPTIKYFCYQSILLNLKIHIKQENPIILFTKQ